MHSLGITAGHDGGALAIAADAEVARRGAATGTFSGRLFYRLNIIHLVAADGPSCVIHAGDAQEGQVSRSFAPKLSQ